MQLIQICRLKRWSLVCLCLVSLLCARISSLNAEEKRTDRCLVYFEEIIEIQRFREMLKIGSEELTHRYERGDLPKEELDSTLEVWYSTENELAQKVAKIYYVANAEKCFEESDESK